MRKLCVGIVVRLLVSIVAQAKKNLSAVMVIRIPNASGFAFGASVGLNHSDDDGLPARAFQIDHLPLPANNQFIKKKIRLADICTKAGAVLKFG